MSEATEIFDDLSDIDDSLGSDESEFEEDSPKYSFESVSVPLAANPLPPGPTDFCFLPFSLRADEAKPPSPL